MSSDSRKERERLKEEYKEHYRKMREVKERLGRVKRTQNITDALREMDTSELMNSFDDFLFQVKSKIAGVEARLEVAMENLAGDEAGGIAEQEADEELKKIRAQEVLRQVKLEMGQLYNEIELQANSMKVEKTIGPDASKNSNSGDDKEAN